MFNSILNENIKNKIHKFSKRGASKLHKIVFELL